jgi:hypothetical protein
MRKLYSVAGALLLLGCMDDASKSTAPQLSGAVVGVCRRQNQQRGQSGWADVGRHAADGR